MVENSFDILVRLRLWVTKPIMGKSNGKLMTGVWVTSLKIIQSSLVGTMAKFVVDHDWGSKFRYIAQEVCKGILGKELGQYFVNELDFGIFFWKDFHFFIMFKKGEDGRASIQMKAIHVAFSEEGKNDFDTFNLK